MGKTEVIAEPGVPQVTITREFDAPRELVHRAYTDPDLLVRWLGPRKYTMKIDYYDLRDGGRWRYIHSDENGNEFAFHGVFHGEITLDGGVQTFEFEGAPGHVSLDTLYLEDRGGKTFVKTVSSFQSVEDRDAMVASGMESGVDEGYERLEEVLASLTS